MEKLMNDLWIGVVEDVNDPKMMGRCKVRIFGLHSDKTVTDQTTGRGVATTDLPWAHVMLPTTSPGMTGYGSTPFILEGSWVVGFSRDAMHNELVIIGTLPGSVSKANPNPINPPAPFAGGDGLYPAAEFVGEPDINRLARGIQKVVPKLMTGIASADGSTWSEKNPQFAAAYPYDHVFQTPAGHIIEIDDTHGSERIMVQHGTSKTYFTILPDGSIQHKTTGDDYEIILKDKKLYVAGSLSITVGKDANVLVGGNAQLQVKGNLLAEVDGTTSLTCKKDVSATLNGNLSAQIDGSVNLTSKGSASLVTQGSLTVNAQGSATITVGGSGSITLGTTTITSPSVNVIGSLQVNGQEVLTV